MTRCYGIPVGADEPAVTGRTADLDEQDESLSEAFWAVARLLRMRNRQTLAPWDITPSQSRAVNVLMRHGTMRLNELSEHLHIVARSTTEVVDGLQERGIVERLPDPNDRRATLVRLTEHGAGIGASIRTARDAEAEALFSGLEPGDRAELARILRALRD
jgi:DNA-binding MarR family transcriptional regulator